MMFHTFVISAYEESPYLESCIKSLKAQTVPSEIICTTSTPSPFLTKLMEKYQIPLYVREGKSDIQEDWNFAISKASGEFVTVAHQDDMYNRHYTEELMKQFDKWPDMTVFMTDAVTVKNGKLYHWGSKEMVKKLLRLPLKLHRYSDKEIIKKGVLKLGNPVMCPSCAYRKNYLPDPIFHSELHFALDWDCMIDLAKWPGRFICVEKPLLYYRVHEDATTGACIRDHSREKEERMIYEKFWSKPVVDLLMHFYQKAYKDYEGA